MFRRKRRLLGFILVLALAGKNLLHLQMQTGDLLIMAAAREERDNSVSSCLLMVSAFLVMEPPDVVISFARDLGEGFIAESVQSCIWESCICKANLQWQGAYLKRFLKKLILEIESSGGIVLDELYEHYACHIIALKESDCASKGSVLKRISFIFPESSGKTSFPESRILEVQLKSSVNILEGDTGCSIWPSSLFLSEFILSYPEIFTSKCCFEVGSGVGLVGICLSYIKASKVILSDGDQLTLGNMKANLELNGLNPGEFTSDGRLAHHHTVHCVYLPWESTSEDDLRCFAPDIILGADIIYDPSCLPSLVRLLAIALDHKHAPSRVNNPSNDSFDEFSGHTPVEHPVAYIASVIRNVDTFNCFLALAKRENLVVTDVTGDVKVSSFLPYMRSYQRGSIRLLKVHV